jgi:hypothetical protein
MPTGFKEMDDGRLLLANDIVEIRFDGQTTTASCRVTFSLKTEEAIWIEAVLDPGTCLRQGVVADLTLKASGTTLKGFLSRLGHVGNVALFVPHLSGPIAVGGSANLTQVELFLVNFRQFSNQVSDTSIRDTVELRADGWRFQVTPLPGDLASAALYKKVGAARKRLTQRAILTRQDGSRFSADDCRRVLDALHLFLSFANGQWMTFMHVRGLAPDQEVVWQEWGTRWFKPWTQVQYVWFDPYHGETLAEAFPGFFDVWGKDAQTREILHTAVYWYIQSNCLAAGYDGSLILSQVALEGITESILTKMTPAISHADFKKLRSAAERFECLFKSFAIPLQIPTSLPALQGVNTLSNGGPAAVTRLRNLVAHSPSYEEAAPVFEAWLLAQWYLEMVLLRLCNFRGKYSNRTARPELAGVVESMP